MLIYKELVFTFYFSLNANNVPSEDDLSRPMKEQLPKSVRNQLLTTASLKMEVGCLGHPGASTIGSQLLDEDCSHGWQILATQP